MPYYILYPKGKTKPVKIVKKRPSARGNSNTYGFAEGSFKTKKDVSHRLNWMNVPHHKRPEGY